MIRKETQIEITIHSENPHEAIDRILNELKMVFHTFAARGEGYVEIKFSSATIEETEEKPKP